MSAPSTSSKRRILIFVVAYHAETTLLRVLQRIPSALATQYHLEVLVIDDGSTDRTFDVGETARRTAELPFRLTVLANPVNQGYGGNQKLGYRYAIEQGFDIVALVHGDGQYAPEVLPELIAPLDAGEADAVFGSRMMQPFAALKGGMPLYKYIGNKILSWYENRVLGTRLTEFHSGYRLYSVAALRRVPFELNTNVFHFDTEIIVQFLFAGLRIREIPIPTYYGDEICRVNGMKYAWDCVRAVTAARLQKYHLVYRRNFDVRSTANRANAHYAAKLDQDSSHTRALALVPENATVVDLGCGPGVLAESILAKRCRYVGVDCHPPALERAAFFSAFHIQDLNHGLGPAHVGDAKVVLLLDVIEHLQSPEAFCRELREALQSNAEARVVITTPNVAYIVIRMMLLLGQFNYGQRGILDLTHTRLFTFSALRRFLQEGGFVVERIEGIPPPIRMALGDSVFARFVSSLHGFATHWWPKAFAYQILAIARPLPTVQTLLRRTEAHSAERRSAAI
ncbi:MAG: glycosyltransferase [Opitutae bacterium]|nr:glycosyltransferase [Opitutae bacterium]